jgi:hypothetical protein
MAWLGAFWSWIRDPNNLTAISTLVIATFTIVLAWVSYCQARLIRKSIDLARTEFISTHRPRIVLRDIHLIDGDVLYMLVNVGDTKATVVESWILMEFLPDSSVLRPLRSFGHDELGRIVFAPGEMKDLTYTVPGVTGTQSSDMMRVGIEEGLIPGKGYFTGTILYEDDLGIRRRSVFRRKMSTDGKGFERLSGAEERDNEYSD